MYGALEATTNDNKHELCHCHTEATVPCCRRHYHSLPWVTRSGSNNRDGLCSISIRSTPLCLRSGKFTEGKQQKGNPSQQLLTLPYAVRHCGVCSWAAVRWNKGTGVKLHVKFSLNVACDRLAILHRIRKVPVRIPARMSSCFMLIPCIDMISYIN